MRDDVTPEGAAFAELLRSARKDAGLLQDDVIQRSGVSRSTYLRWEAGDGVRPDLRYVRKVCQVLGINPRRAAIALGLVTPADLDLAPDESEYDPMVVEINRVLADASVPDAARAALRHTLDAAMNLWRTAVAMPEPHEPRGADLARRRTPRA
ncbi:helix-turn-helix domain-containing protein [Actinoplanes lobatus]|nr:helix-turn-helix transcriptional regulator [Actinoplanes lobatus]MBB4747772.1 transcriptional regulator with XRE-family HTH domain [Actinoplanes lobatus]